MSESIVRKIQPFTIGTKLSVPAVPKYSDVTEDNMSNRSLDNCKLQHNLNDKVSLYLDQPQMCVSERHCAPVMTQDTLEKRCQEEMVKEDHLNRNIASPTATSRAIRKITISSSVETTKETEILRAKQREMKINPNSENINNNNNITTDSAQLPRIVGVSCEKKPSSHFKVPVLLHRDSNNEPSSSNEQTSGFLLNLERCLDVQQTPVLQSQSLKNDLVKGNSSPCRQNEVSMVSKVLSVQKDYFFTQQNALFSKEISQAEAWIQEKLKKLKDIQTCSMMDWEEVTQTLQRDLKDFENTLIQLNQMGEQLMCKLNPTSDMVRKQLSQLRDQWNTLKQTAANQTRVISGFQSLHEFNKKVDKLEAWIKQKQEEEPSLASPLGENNDKLQLTRQLLDLKQDKQLYRNLHEEINQLALKLEKQGKGEGKNISTRRKHINKMWLKIQSHLKDCQDNLQLALEASTFFQQADNFIASVNNMRKALSVTNQATFSGDGEILDIASQIMVLDVTVSQLSNLHPALAARVAEKQAKVKDSWLLLQSTVRNVKTEPLTSVCFVTGEDSDLSISNKELFSSMGMDQHRIMGKEVKDEQNRLKGTTGGRSLDLTRKPLDSHQEPLPNPVVSVGNTCTSEVSTKFQDQSKSGAMPKTHSHPHLHEQLEKFTVSADKTLSWLKDSVTMATHICSSGGGPSSYEAAKRYQASLEQDILSNKARIELVKKEGHSLVRAHHPGSAKIQDFLSQLEVLWEELKKRHQRNGMILRGSEELNYRAVKLLQGLGSLEAWLEAVELSIRQASLAGDPESVSVAERESRLLERELETHNLDLHNLKQELEALQSQRHLHTQLLPSRMEQVERKFRSIQMALTQQSSELKDTRMLTEFLERVELEENHYGSVGQPLQSDLDCASPLLPLRESRNSKPLIESLGDPVEELREAVEMLNDTARERSRSQSHDQCIQELISRHSIVVARVEQCLQRCTELAVDVLDMESEMAVRCEPEHCGMDSLQEQQDQLEADFAGLKEKVDAMDNLSARLLDLCPERVHTLGNKVQSSLQAWGELAKSIAENRSRLLQFGHLRHFFRKYLAMISWTEDTRSRIFSESALHHENQGSLVELLDKQIEQKFQEFDILASAGKKLLNEDHHLAKMIKERMEELRSMLGWILVHWRAQKIQWLNRKRAEEPHNDAIYSEATICSLLPELESETSSEDQLKTQGPVTVSLSGLEDNVQQDNGYELMESVTLKDSKTQSGSEELDSPYLVLKEPSTPSLGGTVNLILSFGNSGDSQLQVEESDTEKAEQFSEAVHRPTVPHSSVYKSFWKRCQGLFGSLKRKKKVYQQSAEEGHSLNFLSVHIDLEGAGPDSDTLVHSPTTRGHSSLVSGRREFPSMEGTLERKHKLLVGGRMALCRTWSSYHAVLYRQTLCFYHDRKDTISNSVISFPINLNGAECVQAPEYTKKPNCFSLRLCDGSEYLFSAPSHFMMKKWILQIQANTESSESEANINTSCGPAAQSVFPRSVSSPVRCQCEALCQCSMKGEESLNLPSCRQLGSARTKQIIFLEQDSSNIPQQHCEKMEELSSTLYSHASHYDSLGDLPDQKLHSQSFRGLSYSLCPSQDCSTSKKRSHSFTSATYQRIKPVRLPPKGRGQDSNSSYSVTLFIGDGEKPSVCSSTALLQPISSRQKSPELPHMSYASLPQSQSKSVFRKFFGKKD
ncbi:spectrin beta chain, non-erythrocytic 1 isoform X6 [Electrophorus electricus]|uniref:spectrin beta chain, non-erythrocytic 1 isoform X6 n=1 Tax=Electrophorus electricus TaxID=8005 RepID=UPI0015D08C03|nr:spectrin beta chain, non-erythrocytic 1 isoform X6 [Electrophorus electricus]